MKNKIIVLPTNRKAHNAKKQNQPSMSCGGKKRGCHVTVLPYFTLVKAA